MIIRRGAYIFFYLLYLYFFILALVIDKTLNFCDEMNHWIKLIIYNWTDGKLYKGMFEETVGRYKEQAKNRINKKSNQEINNAPHSLSIMKWQNLWIENVWYTDSGKDYKRGRVINHRSKSPPMYHLPSGWYVKGEGGGQNSCSNRTYTVIFHWHMAVFRVGWRKNRNSVSGILNTIWTWFAPETRSL